MSEDVAITALGDYAAVHYFPAIDKDEADADGRGIGVQKIGFRGNCLGVEDDDIGVVAFL